MQDTETCATSRFGPDSPFFHFPRQNEAELGSFRDWAWGSASELTGYVAYAWDGTSVLQAKCHYTETVTIDTGIVPGSLEAFGTYLHSLADSYSHRECQQALDAAGAPWGTHTLPPAGIDACTYNPYNYQNDDAHGREFGGTTPDTQWYSDTLRTDEAGLAVYAELVQRSLTREGRYYPIRLDGPVTGIAGATTLREALYNYAHNWPYMPFQGSEPEDKFARQRRVYADQIAAAVLLQRESQHRLFLPALR
jgi:hypothetical protein